MGGHRERASKMVGSLPQWIPDADLCLLALMPLCEPRPLEGALPAHVLVTTSTWPDGWHVTNDVRPQQARDCHPAGIHGLSRARLALMERAARRGADGSLRPPARGSEPFSTRTREDLDPATAT